MTADNPFRQLPAVNEILDAPLDVEEAPHAVAIPSARGDVSLQDVTFAFGRGGVVLNVSSDAAVTPYPGWGAYGASKAALRHLSAIWDAELAGERIHVLSIDPGDMDTPLHAAAVPDADRTQLRDPAAAAADILQLLCAHLPDRLHGGIAA